MITSNRNNILQVANLHKTFYKPGTGRKETIKAVQGIDFSVYSGQVMGLIGASGSGKTTTLKVIFGLENPDTGNVKLKEEELTAASGKKKRNLLKKMGLVFQDPYNSLCPRYKVWESLTEPLVIHREVKNTAEARSRAEKILEKIELDPSVYFNRYPHQLSGGERQRVALGRALILEPVFLALDEPTSMLDATTKRGILELINKTAQQMELGILLITHDLAMASHVCNEIAVMQEGKIVESGSTNIVTTRPQHPYTKKLLLAATDLEAFWEA